MMPEFGEKRMLVELFEGSELRLLEATDVLSRMEGIASRGNIINRNGRYYPTEVLRNAVEKAQPLVESGEMTGELEHPDYDAYGRLDRTAFRITKLWMDGDLCRFESVILNTPAGRTLKALLEGGVRIGISTRGFGSLRPERIDDQTVVSYVENFELLGVDAVKRPSNPDSVAQLKESEEVSMIKTLEELKTAYPELVAELEERVIAERVAPLEGEKAQLERELKEVKDRLKQVENHFTKLVESIKNTAITLGLVSEPDVDITKRLNALESENTKLKDELGKAVNQLTLFELRDKLTKVFEEKVRGHRFEQLLRENVKLENFRSVEHLEGELDRVIKLSESIEAMARKPDEVPRGKGQLFDNTHIDEDQQMALWRKLALG